MGGAVYKGCLLVFTIVGIYYIRHAEGHLMRVETWDLTQALVRPVYNTKVCLLNHLVL